MDVVLLGVVARGMENHSLTALSGALDAAGFQSCVVPFGGFAELDSMVDSVLRIAPRICGLSMQTTEATLAAVTFTRILRDRGFAGQIVVGGHVATLMASELLAVCSSIDVVVELAGEAAIVGLARGEDPASLPGTRTRAGSGRAAVAVTPRAIRRERMSEHLGFGAVDLVLSRGCAASCGYCCVAAISESSERAGGPRHVVREVAAIADEIAETTERGARAFHFMDDNLLPLDPVQAVAWAIELRDALARRQVPRIAFSLQLRADVVTAALADVLVELGLARAYIGIDGYSQGQLRSIGRSAPASAGQSAIDALSARGVYCVANALLIGPTLRFDTVLVEIDALAQVRGAPVHLLPIEARPGTVYHRRAVARGLIEGSPLWPVYRFEDERTFLLGEVVTHLPTRLEERSVPIALYDLGWALGVARVLAPAADVAAAAATYARATKAWNADQIRILRAACGAAIQGQAAIDELLAAERDVVRAHDEALLRACDAALADVERAVSAIHRRPVRAHARGRLLGGVAFAMSLASACQPPSRPVVDGPPIDVMVDAFVATCVDPARTVGDLGGADMCACAGASTSITLTFNDRGVVTALAGAAAPLPADVERCLLDVFSTHCYPSLAGMMRTFPTCHSWIA